MDDRICRKAAIDAIEELISARREWLSANARDEIKGLDAAICEIQNLPAADVPDRKVGKWIPVSERLPREYTRVIGYMAWHAMTAIEYQHGKWYSIDHLEPLPDEAVSHWMPLPKPPKGGDK